MDKPANQADDKTPIETPSKNVNLRLSGHLENGRFQMQCAIENFTAHQVVLDQRLLNPVLLTKVEKVDGTPVAKLPPPVPREDTDEDALIIPPNSKHEVHYPLESVVDISLIKLPVKVRCVYQVGKNVSAKGANLWQEHLESNTILVPEK